LNAINNLYQDKLFFYYQVLLVVQMYQEPFQIKNKFNKINKKILLTPYAPPGAKPVFSHNKKSFLVIKLG